MSFRLPGRAAHSRPQRHVPRTLRRFLSSHTGAVTVDFVPLIAAAIGLAIAVVSFLGASITAPTARVSSLLDSVVVGAPPPGPSELPQAGPDGVPSIENAPTGDSPERDPVTPDVSRGPASTPGASGGSSGGTTSAGGGVTTKTMGVVGIVTVGSLPGSSQSVRAEAKDGDKDGAAVGEASPDGTDTAGIVGFFK